MKKLLFVLLNVLVLSAVITTWILYPTVSEHWQVETLISAYVASLVMLAVTVLSDRYIVNFILTSVLTPLVEVAWYIIYGDTSEKLLNGQPKHFFVFAPSGYIGLYAIYCIIIPLTVYCLASVIKQHRENKN